MKATLCSYKLRSLLIVPSDNYQVPYPSSSLELIAALCRHQTQSEEDNRYFTINFNKSITR
ncbi:hypothetical protein I7I53_00130 [Histoplasma capsulatum var. duboisii H88]|uniref:Uncharacterized protein n=1 Tax=Ajellomyces capsulatus (strain H88) TaxID=544711 RepID=A0A8A1LLZ1_AJEC8|nr:hypothetical protein I7I53_00130 [Histoplasma capsulatum var. duboisii H88]